MSRHQRKKTKAEKLPEIVDFRFLQFHATKIPNDWDKLVISVISVETGKAIARTNKAVVRGGNCKWLEDVSESVRFLQDDISRELEEKLYKFVVSMGSARLGILGEATVNLADYLNSKELIWVKLPLRKCNHGTILHVKIQCVTPRSSFRQPEFSSTTGKEEAEQVSVFDEEDAWSEGSVRSQRSLNGQSKSTFQQMESKYQDADYLVGTLHHGLNSLELSAADTATNGNSKGFAPGEQASPSSTKNSFHKKQQSAGLQDGIEKYKAGNGMEQYKGRLFGGKDSGTVEYPMNGSFDRETLGSHGSFQDGLQNGNKSSLVGGLTIGNGSSNEFLDAAEVTIQELRKESMMWEQKAQKFILETETLKQELAEQQRQHREIEMQFLTTRAERDSFKQEVEQLQSALQVYIESKKGADNANSEVQDAKRMVKEFEDEIKFHKESNANLNLQLNKIQEANTELVFALQDLEETIEQQNVEIEKLMEARERYHDVDNSKWEPEEMRHYADLGIKFSDVVVERDNLKKEIDQLRSVVEHGIPTYNIQTRESNVKDAVPESLEDIKNGEFNKNVSLNGQNSLILYEQFSSTVPEIDEQMTDQDNETAEWMQKLSYQKEEIRTLKNKIPPSPSNHSSREVTVYMDESQQDQHQDLMTLKQDMNELERDCKELTDENLELIYNLNELKRNLVSKNAYITELEGKLRAPSFESTLPGFNPLYNTEFTSVEMSPCSSPSRVMKVQNDSSNLGNKFNTFEERIIQLESELENAHERTAKMEQILAASLIDSQATNIMQQLAGPIKKGQTLKLKDSDGRIFIDGLPASVTHLNEKVDASEHRHRIELANMEKSMTEYQSQVLALEGQKLELECNYHSLVLELESQKLELECVLDIFKNRVCSLESEVITTQQETIEREIQLTVNYESYLEDTVARAENEVADVLQMVRNLEAEKSKHMIQIKTLNNHLSDLEKKLKRTADLSRVEIASKEKLVSDFQYQVINLQNQNRGLQDELIVLTEKNCDLENEIETAEKEILKREEDVTSSYEYILQRTEERAIRAEYDLANSLERVKSFESNDVKDATMIDDFKVQISQLQKELKSSEEVYGTQLVSFQNQVTKLQGENNIFENKISILSEKICELENAAEKAQQEAIQREQEIASKEKVLGNFQHQAIDIQNQNNRLQSELNVFKERIYDLESEVQTAQLEKVEREKEMRAAYKFKLQRMDARVIRAETDLTESLEKIKSFESHSAKDTIIIDQLKMQIIQLQKELRSAEDEHATRLAGLEKTLSEFHYQVMKLQSENGILENNVKILKEKISELENVAQRAQQEGLDKVKDLSVAHELKLQAEEARAREAEEELAKVLKSIIESDNARHKMGEIISEQQNQVKAIEDQFAKVQDELTISLKTIRDLEADKARISLELSNECQRRQSAENATGSLDRLNQELQTKIQNIESEYVESNLQLNQLEKTHLEQQRQLDSHFLIEKHLQENIKELEIVKMKLHSEIENLQQEECFRKSCIQDLNCQLSALTIELQSLKCSNQTLGIQATKLQMENAGLEEKLDGARKESKSASDRLENLGKLLEQLRADAESNLLAKTNLEKRAMEIEQIKGGLESQLKEKEKKISHLLKQVHNLEIQLNFSEEERNFFRLDLEIAEATCFNLQAEMKMVELNLKEENVKLLQVLDESQSKLSATVEEVDSCKREQHLLESSLENLTREYAAAMELNKELREKCSNLFESQNNVEQCFQKMMADISISFNQIKSLESDLSILQRNVEGEMGIWAQKSEAYQLNTREYEETCVEADKIVGQLYPEDENVLKNLQEEVQSLSKQVYLILEEKERILTEALIEASGLREEKKDLENSLQLQLANVKDSEAELLQVKRKCESKVQDLKLEVDVARKKEEEGHFNLGHVNRQLEDTKVREANLREKVQGIEAVENEKQKIKAENTILKEKVDQLLSLKAETNSTQDEKQKLKTENDSLRGQITQLMDLKAETDALQNVVEQVRDEKTTLQQSLHSTEVEVERLKAENILLMEKLAATMQRLAEVDKLTQRNAELQERILGIQDELNDKEVEQKNKSVQIQNQSGHLQWGLHDLEEEGNKKYINKENSLGYFLQLKVNNISKSKEILPGSSDCEVRCTSPQQDEDTDQSTKLSDRIVALQSELETYIKQFEEKEETLITEIQKLEEMNHQLMQAKLDSDTDQLQIELIRLQKQNSDLLQKQHELLSKLAAHELLQKEVYRLQEENKQLETQLTRFVETAKGGNILERVVAMEAELVEALEANSMYQIQLQSFLQQERNLHITALQSYGPIDQIVNDLVAYKRKNAILEAELNDLRERYSNLSLKLAEVEVQREELVMTIKRANYGKR